MSECPHVRPILGDYELGALDDGMRRRVEAHLLVCAACRDEMELVRWMRRGVTRLLETAPPVDVRAGVMRGVERRAPGPRVPRLAVLAAALVLAAAGSLLHPGARAQAAQVLQVVLGVAGYVRGIVQPGDAADDGLPAFQDPEPVDWLNEGDVSRLILKVSPDGKKVWYGEGVRTNYFGASRLQWEDGARSYIANLADGSGRVELPEGVRDLEWSPDSNWVAFVKPGQTGEVIVMRPNSASERQGDATVAVLYLVAPGDDGEQRARGASWAMPVGWSADSRTAYFWVANTSGQLLAVSAQPVSGEDVLDGAGAHPGAYTVTGSRRVRPVSPPSGVGDSDLGAWRGDQGRTSPDGRWFALFKEYHGADGDITRMDLYAWSLPDGRERLLHRFDVPQDPAEPPMAVAGWMPDGASVLVSDGRDPDHPKLYRVTLAEPSEVHEIMEIRGPLLNVVSSPDGRWLLMDDEGRLQVMAADGSERRELVRGSEYETLPEWLPDGSVLFYRFGKEEGWYRMERRPDAAGEAGGFAAWLNELGEAPEVLSVSPDGSRVLYSVVQSRRRFFLADVADGGNRVRVDADPDLDSAVWSRDGRYLAQVVRFGTEPAPAVVDAATGEVTERPLAVPPSGEVPDALPRRAFFAWGPDGESVQYVVRTGGGLDVQYQVWTVPVDPAQGDGRHRVALREGRYRLRFEAPGAESGFVLLGEDVPLP